MLVVLIFKFRPCSKLWFLQNSKTSFRFDLVAPDIPAKFKVLTVYKIFEDTEEEDDNDPSKSIYKPRSQVELEIAEDDREEEMCSFMETPENR